MRILLGAFIFGIIGLFTFIGVMTPGMGWFLYFFLIPFWAMFPIIIVGVKGALILLAIYVIGFPIAKLIVSRAAVVREGREGDEDQGHARRSAGWSMSSRSGGELGRSSSSSGGGGFPGGGGSSGGGGALGQLVSVALQRSRGDREAAFALVGRRRRRFDRRRRANPPRRRAPRSRRRVPRARAPRSCSSPSRAAPCRCV